MNKMLFWNLAPCQPHWQRANSGKPFYTMPLMIVIHVWRIVTENCVWRKILKCCAWRLTLKHCAWRVISKHCTRRPPDATFQDIASDACQTPARHKLSKSSVRRKISKSCARRYILWPCVRRAVRVWLCKVIFLYIPIFWFLVIYYFNKLKKCDYWQKSQRCICSGFSAINPWSFFN